MSSTAYGKLIGNASSDTETVQYVVNVLKQYNDNLSTYVTDYAKGQAVYEIVKGMIDMSLIYRIRIKLNETMWYGKIDNFINEG